MRKSKKNIVFFPFCSGNYFFIVKKSVTVNKFEEITLGIFGKEVSPTILGITLGETSYICEHHKRV